MKEKNDVSPEFLKEDWNLVAKNKSTSSKLSKRDHTAHKCVLNSAKMVEIMIKYYDLIVR